MGRVPEPAEHLAVGVVQGREVVAFGALGKHSRNILPIMLGVYLMCDITHWSHNEYGPLLAALFCTTLK